jgi:integrase/recombinase XerD
MENQQTVSHHTWLAPLAAEYLDAQGGSPKTILIRRQALTHLQRFLDAQGRERLPDVTAADLEAWRLDLRQRNFAPASLEVFCRSVRQFFNWLEQGQRVFTNPAAGFIVPRPPRPLLPVLTPEQVQRLLSQPDRGTAIGVRDRALFAAVYATGIAAQELRTLHCHDASREAVKVRGHKPRTLPLDAYAAEALPRYLDQARPKLLGKNKTPALWLTNRGAALTHEALQQVFSRHSKAAGLGYITPAAVRRACVVHRWQAGAHPLELQLLLGHASLRSLCQYLRVTTIKLFNPSKETRHETATIA